MDQDVSAHEGNGADGVAAARGRHACRSNVGVHGYDLCKENLTLMVSCLLVNKSRFLYMSWIVQFEHRGTSRRASRSGRCSRLLGGGHRILRQKNRSFNSCKPIRSSISVSRSKSVSDYNFSALRYQNCSLTPFFFASDDLAPNAYQPTSAWYWQLRASRVQKL